MKIPKSSCPRCNSLQSFPALTRDSDQGEWQEIYVRCTMCRYEQIIKYTTAAIISAEQLVCGVEARVIYETSRYGRPSTSTQQALVRRKADLALAHQKLQEHRCAN